MMKLALSALLAVVIVGYVVLAYGQVGPCEIELMRKVSRREEANQIVNGRAGWTYKLLRCKKIDLSMLEEAPF
jgi:hypothetical protein